MQAAIGKRYGLWKECEEKRWCEEGKVRLGSNPETRLCGPSSRFVFVLLLNERV